MAKKRRGDEGAGGDSWMNTYADMVTLLLTFFAVLLSMSNTDEAKFNAFVRSFSNLPQEVVEEIVLGNNNEEDVNEGDIPYVSSLNELYLSLKKYVEDNNQGNAVSVKAKDDIVYVSFNSMVFFHPDEATLIKSSMPVMDFIGKGLKKYEDIIRAINVCGHTADIEGFGTSDVSAWVLSAARAAEVGRFFDEEKKIDPKKLIMLGYGGERPVATNSNEAGRAQNRRVELVIVGVDSAVNFNAADPTGVLMDTPDPAQGLPGKGEGEKKTDSASQADAPESSGGKNDGGDDKAQSAAGVSSTPQEEPESAPESAPGGESAAGAKTEPVATSGDTKPYEE